MKPLIAAIQFLTVLPLGARGTYEPRAMIGWFPIVGLLLGCVLAGFDAAAARLWTPPAAAVLDVLLLILLTGALHLDGVGDTADGLYGRRPAEKALQIMKDSRIGAMALVTVVAVLALKWAGLAGLDKGNASLAGTHAPSRACHGPHGQSASKIGWPSGPAMSFFPGPWWVRTGKKLLLFLLSKGGAYVYTRSAVRRLSAGLGRDLALIGAPVPACAGPYPLSPCQPGEGVSRRPGPDLAPARHGQPLLARLLLPANPGARFSA